MTVRAPQTLSQSPLRLRQTLRRKSRLILLAKDKMTKRKHRKLQTVTDVLLIAAPLGVRSEHAQLSPPLGLALIGACCQEAGFSTTAIDFNLSGLNLVRLQGVLNYDRPRVIGISANTETWTAACEIAATCKETLPDATVVVGGAHPSILPGECLRESKADYVIAGPGERSFTTLVEQIIRGPKVDPEVISGLYYRLGNAACGNQAEPLGDPDKLPWADRDLFPISQYRDRCTVLTSTGSCPYRCSFCSASAIWRGRRRYRSVENIMEELTALANTRGIRDVFFADDIFTLNRSWTLELCDALSAADLCTTWGCATRIDRVDDELLEAMAAAGCDGIQFGIESGAADILQSVKGIDKDMVIHAVGKAQELGIKTLCSFMVPFPEDTLETLAETRRFMKELGALGSDIGMSFTCPYPGTPLYAQAKELGIRIIPQTWDEFSTRSPMIETRYLNARQIKQFAEETALELGFRRTAAE